MKWFGGSIAEAIQTAKVNSSLLIVYISGDDEMSQQMEEVWADTAVCELCERERCVGLTFKADSDACKQFGAFYPVVCIPSTYFIGKDGVPLEIVGGNIATREFYKKIQNATQMHKNSTSAAPQPASGAASTPETLTTSPPATTPTEAQPSPAIPEPVIPTKPAETPASATSTQPTVDTTSEPAAKTEPEPAAGSEAGEPGGGQKPSLDDRMEKARQVIEEKNRKKAEKEKEEAKRKERERREVGQNLHRFQKMKADMEADEIKQARQKEKREEREARERVRQQIAQDKADRAARTQKAKEEAQKETAAPKVVAPATAPAASTATRSSESDRKRIGADRGEAEAKRAKWETARLQFRLPDGSAVTNQFPSSDTLSTARDFIKQRVSFGSFSLSTTYPKRVFTEADMSQTLLDLNLAPSAVVIVLPSSGPLRSSGGSGGGGMLMTLLAPFMALWGFICNFLFGQPQNPGGSSNPTTPKPSSQATASAPSPDQSQSSDRPRPGTSRGRPKSSYGIRRRQEGNIHRLSAEDDDEDQTTWNGNSTQQM